MVVVITRVRRENHPDQTSSQPLYPEWHSFPFSRALEKAGTSSPEL